MWLEVFNYFEQPLVYAYCSIILHYGAAAEDEPLPGIDGLQIAGDPFPGRELQACGYSINGTTSCNFEVYVSEFHHLIQARIV